MKRDDDLIRELLLRYEAEDEWLLMVPAQTLGASKDERREKYHVLLMMDEGLLAEVGRGTMRMTSFGHDYLETIRDRTIWEKAKEGAERAGGATVRLLFDVASAYLRKQMSEITGLEI